MVMATSLASTGPDSVCPGNRFSTSGRNKYSYFQEINENPINLLYLYITNSSTKIFQLEIVQLEKKL